MKKPTSIRAVHAGEARRKPLNSLTTPVVYSSTFVYQDTAEVLAHTQAKAEGARPARDEYGRFSHPTQSAAEAKINALEGGEGALLFSSGMSAITTAMLTLLEAGDHLLMPREGFYITRQFTQNLLSRWGIETSLVPVDSPEALASAIRPNTRLIFAEIPTNPYLRVVDLERLAQVARAHGIPTLVDSTFATPVNLRPLEHGIDLVVHSATKYLGGHNDLLAGVVTGARRLLAEIEKVRGVMGGMSNPHDAYLLLRGMKTLELRVQRQNENGMQVARFLEGHPAVRRVYYPGLPSHPDASVARRLLSGFGGVVSFEIEGDFAATSRFIDRLRLPYIGLTLGGVESIVQQPAAHYSLEPLERKAAGIPDNLVRYALGIESAVEIIADLRQALDGDG